jgi:hypothetical protein
MIRTVLELIRNQLNAFLRNADPRVEDWVVLSNIVDHQGRPFAAAKGKVVMVLANITHATSAGTSSPPARATPGVGAQAALPIELFIVFFANFDGQHYAEGLAAISRIIGFFHGNPIFTHANVADLDPSIDRLTMELADLTLPELHDLMGMLGAKYLPSTCYKLRTIPH